MLGRLTMRVLGGLIISLFFMIQISEAENFLSKQHASQILVRKRRANTFMEETKKGNLERECIEELCNREEAREVFENDPETNYFYPLYLACLGSFRVGSFVASRQSTNAYTDLRSCVNAIPNQCNPLPCNEVGYERCIDGQAQFTCICKTGWHGTKCEEDINECEDPAYKKGGCSQICTNLPGTYRCSCESGFFLLSDKKDCRDINECAISKVCGKALCKNTPGDFECECPSGYNYNPASMECEDVDECAENKCTQLCVNYPGGYTCYCDGKKGFRLAQDQKSCEVVPLCLPLNLEKNYELLYLAEQFVGIPVLYLRFRLPETTRFSAEFDFRTYDPEGIILYAESIDHSAWFLLALRDGKIEIQFKNEHGTKVTSGGKIINNGLWNIVSVEELENSISVKIAKEAVMNINSPGRLFRPFKNGFLETKVFFAGLPRIAENNLLKSINPRLDGCIRGWNLMNQGASGVKEIIQEKQNKHCLVTVEKGSYYPGSGVAQFDIDYNNVLNAEEWQINVTLNIRPSTGTGVMLALVSGDTVPLALLLVDSSTPGLQDVLVTIENTTVSRMEAKKLCTHEYSNVELRVSRGLLELTNGFNGETIYYEDLKAKLAILDRAMTGRITTYLGGIPDVPINASLVNVFYNGCMDVKINGRELDLDEAVFKQNDIRSHSCPTVSKNPSTF